MKMVDKFMLWVVQQFLKEIFNGEYCTDIFVDACLFCQDLNGWSQCKDGYDVVKDYISGLFVKNLIIQHQL